MTDFRYASGEEPRIGDLVRRAAANASGDVFDLKPGDVFEVKAIRDVQPYIGLLGVKDGFTCWAPNCFTLLARAGDPVTYLPDDVVEFTAEHAALPVRKVGDRFTVCDPAYVGAPLDLLRYRFLDGHESHAPAGYFRLVHRPDAQSPAAAQQVIPCTVEQIGRNSFTVTPKAEVPADLKGVLFSVVQPEPIPEQLTPTRGDLKVGDRTLIRFPYGHSLKLAEVVNIGSGTVWVRALERDDDGRQQEDVVPFSVVLAGLEHARSQAAQNDSRFRHNL